MRRPLEQIAIHEAGHVVLAIRGHTPFTCARVNRRGRRLGAVEYIACSTLMNVIERVRRRPRPGRRRLPRSQFLAVLGTVLGGAAAEAIARSGWPAGPGPGPVAIADDAIGLLHELGPLSRADDRDTAAAIVEQIRGDRPSGAALRAAMVGVVRQLLSGQNFAAVKAIAKDLLERESVDYGRARRIYRKVTTYSPRGQGTRA
jgi:hypothetical protein